MAAERIKAGLWPALNLLVVFVIIYVSQPANGKIASIYFATYIPVVNELVLLLLYATICFRPPMRLQRGQNDTRWV